MIFHEVYGAYFRAVECIINKAVEGKLTDEALYRIVENKAFAESCISIPNALKSNEWPLLKADYSSPIKNKPQMPVTKLEKRWLKSIMQDPRIKLFEISEVGLEDVLPLYSIDSFVYFDRYLDGDPYEDEEYQKNFRTILKGLQEKKKLRIHFNDNRGNNHCRLCIPYNIEYSSKDNKFRLQTLSENNRITINIARINACELLDMYLDEEYCPLNEEKHSIIILLRDERNTLERLMLHFSHLDKETIRLDNDNYRVIMKYSRDDETEMLIRLLSFGPTIRILEPKEIIEQIKERIKKQEELRNL